MEQEQFQSMVIQSLQVLNTEVAGIKTDIAGIKSDLAGVKSDIASIKEDIHMVKQDVRMLQEQGSAFQRKLDELYQAREFIKMKFGMSWAFFSFFLAFVASGLTKFLWR